MASDTLIINVPTSNFYKHREQTHILKEEIISTRYLKVEGEDVILGATLHLLCLDHQIPVEIKYQLGLLWTF